MVSVIIPVYNDEKSVAACLSSLFAQNYPKFEIIVVDDGSTDDSIINIKEQSAKIRNIPLTLLIQKHQGPGIARNYGAKNARGKILVFVDSDMTFDRNFIRNLVSPIESGQTIGTFTKEERLLNDKKNWAVDWNINRYFTNRWNLDREMYQRILPTSYPDTQEVFRAIVKYEFDKVSGFDNIGYTDDWTLSRKLSKKAVSAKGAICYHRNPETLIETFNHARWIGNNEFISGNVKRRMFNFIRYFFPFSIIAGLLIGIKLRRISFPLFKIVYDLGIWISILTK